MKKCLAESTIIKIIMTITMMAIVVADQVLLSHNRTDGLTSHSYGFLYNRWFEWCPSGVSVQWPASWRFPSDDECEKLLWRRVVF